MMASVCPRGTRPQGAGPLKDECVHRCDADACQQQAAAACWDVPAGTAARFVGTLQDIPDGVQPCGRSAAPLAFVEAADAAGIRS